MKKTKLMVMGLVSLCLTLPVFSAELMCETEGYPGKKTAYQFQSDDAATYYLGNLILKGKDLGSAPKYLRINYTVTGYVPNSQKNTPIYIGVGMAPADGLNSYYSKFYVQAKITGNGTFAVEAPVSNENGFKAVAVMMTSDTYIYDSTPASSDMTITAYASTKANNGWSDQNKVTITLPRSTYTSASQTLPDSVNLGSIDYGDNTTSEPLNLTSGNPDIKLTVNSVTDGALFSNNGINVSKGESTTITDNIFAPGLYLTDSAKAGEHSATVNASWTCP